MKRTITSTLLGLGMLAGMAVTVMAAPAASGLRGAEAGIGTSLVEKVHGCHRERELGGAGWHRHVGPYCRRIAVPPPHHRHRPHCETKCHYIGPIKTCKKVCD